MKKKLWIAIGVVLFIKIVIIGFVVNSYPKSWSLESFVDSPNEKNIWRVSDHGAVKKYRVTTTPDGQKVSLNTEKFVGLRQYKMSRKAEEELTVKCDLAEGVFSVTILSTEGMVIGRADKINKSMKIPLSNDDYYETLIVRIEGDFSGEIILKFDQKIKT